MTKTNDPLRAAAMLAVLLVGGCNADLSLCPDGDQCDPPPPTPVSETRGAMAVGTFRWDCVGPGDATCGTGEFPTAVAVGGRFDLDFSSSFQVPDEIVFTGIDAVSP